MIKLSKTISIFLLILLIQSCKEKTEVSIEKKVDTNSFEYKLENKPKYFLKFWGGMSNDEFNKVFSLLVSDKTLTTFGLYYTGVGEFRIEPITDDKNIEVIGVRILDINEDFYSLLKEKYNLPNLVDKSSIRECFIETNPCYLQLDCKKYKNRGRFISLTTPKNLEATTKFTEDIYIRKVLPEDEIEFTSNIANIIIKNTWENSVINSSELSYALHKEYSLDNVRFFYFDSSVKNPFYNFSKEESSEKRAVVISSNLKMSVEYYPYNYFKKRQEKRNESRNKSIQMDMKKQEVINKTKNDI